MAIGVAARAGNYLAALSFWYDEAFLLLPVYEMSARVLIGPLPTQTIVPPLVLWLLKGAYLLAGPGELAMRLPTFAAGVAGVLLFIPAAVRLLGRPAGYWAAGLCALSHSHVMHGSEV
ncbi:MAG: glycosyltransferase family 39 protein, partial [Gemmataceae bacterium]